jgi:hypothetical protein
VEPNEGEDQAFEILDQVVEAPQALRILAGVDVNLGSMLLSILRAKKWRFR